MGKEHTRDLLKFMSPFPPTLRNTALWLREFVWDLYPSANELIYDNYNALAVGWSPTDKVGHTFCSIAMGRSSHNLHFGFYWGAEIADPKKLLIGNGNQYRYLLVTSKEEFPQVYIRKLMKDAYANSLRKVKPGVMNEKLRGQTFTKSVSAAKRKPPAVKKRKKL